MLERMRLAKRLILTGILSLSFLACTSPEDPGEFYCPDGECDGGFQSGGDTEPYVEPADCPNDPAKDNPGICGCGVPDVDEDGDGYMDCVDKCASDPEKLNPGICGCGVPDTNSDGDSLPDCMEECPDDSLKVEPGICGCGLPDRDSDGDGTLDCLEECPDDPQKIEAGNCGCGVDENEWFVDNDNDAVPNCVDGCVDDPNKDEPGDCGCGIEDIDSDSDGTANCIDECPYDGSKTKPGKCGCGILDTDSDGDGLPDCQDSCPFDAAKTAPGFCGCGRTETECLVTVTLSVDDAMVNQSWPSNNYNGSAMSIDKQNDPGLTYVLIKPLGIGNIPRGANVKSAQLTITIFDSGDKISIRKLYGSFSESKVTYNSRPSHSGEFASMSGKKGTPSSNVLSAVQAWVNGEDAYGLALYPTGSNGVDMYSSEYSFASSRPKFTIVYYDPNS